MFIKTEEVFFWDRQDTDFLEWATFPSRVGFPLAMGLPVAAFIPEWPIACRQVSVCMCMQTGYIQITSGSSSH